MDSLESEGLKFDRNELVKILINRRPTDEQGNLDFHAGYEILQDRKVAEQAQAQFKSAAKKQVASQTMEGGQAEGSPKDYRTPKDLRYRDWSDLAV
jgi:hypothetical protein